MGHGLAATCDGTGNTDQKEIEHMDDSTNIEKSSRISRRSFVKLTAITGASISYALALGGCSGQTSAATTESSTQTSTETSNVVVDANGTEFTIPDSVERIVITCQGGTTHEVAIFGGADMIKAQPSMAKFPQLLKMYPQFNDVVNGGSFDDVNIETLAAQEPDVALVGISSEKGNAQIAGIGIPTYVMLIGWAAIDTLKQEFLNVGKIVGGEDKAQQLFDHWTTTLDALQAKLASIPEAERKSIYYISSADITKANKGDWGRTWIAGVNADFAIPDSDSTGDVTVEKAIAWDPDIIIVQGGNDINQLLDNEQLQDMQAIKNKQVYSCPIGGFWWDRPSPEATLGFLWLAKTAYPEYTKDIDLKAETVDFFQTFYEYYLPDDEYESFF